MKNFFLTLIAFFCITLTGCSSYSCNSCPSYIDKNDSIFQVSTINALIKGCYDSEITMAQLCQKGDTGIGTFNHLDGEMVMDQGKVYQVKSNGKVYPIHNTQQKTPFASVVHFKPDTTFNMTEEADLVQIKKEIKSRIKNPNALYAIRMQGQFEYVKTRSVPAQKKPYPPLTEDVKNQPIFEFENINGTIVGFLLPDYVQGLNVTSFHLHFLDSTKTKGGHLLNCKAKNIKISIDQKNNLTLTLPNSNDFASQKLNDVSLHQVESVEK